MDSIPKRKGFVGRAGSTAKEQAMPSAGLEASAAVQMGSPAYRSAASRSWRILRSPLAAWRKRRGETPAARWKVRTKLERSPKPTS